MNKTILSRLFQTVISIVILSIGFASYARAESSNGGVDVYYDLVSSMNMNYMPSKGDAKAVAILVNFPDQESNKKYTKEVIQDRLNGDQISLKSFLNNASYGQLNFSCDVYGWYTTEHEMAYYENLIPFDTIMGEINSKNVFDIDWSKYDGNNDGTVDCVYLIFDRKVANEELWRTYWSYHDFETPQSGISYGGYVIALTNSFYNEDDPYFEFTTVSVLAHETGHAMGLYDYYVHTPEYSYFPNEVMMSDASGDYDAFSKMLLGWIVPQEVSDSAEISLLPIGEKSDAVIIYPDGDRNSSVFYMLEYITRTKNLHNCGDVGIRIYTIQARLDEYNNFGSASYYYKILDVLEDHMKENDYVDVDTNPSTFLFELDENGNYIAAQSKKTVSITCGEQTNDYAKCKIVYKDYVKREVQYTIEQDYSANEISFWITFNQSVSVINNNATGYRGDNEEQFTLYGQTDNGADRRRIRVVSSANTQSDSVYRVVIPKDSLLLESGYNDEIEISISTNKLITGTDYDRVGSEPLFYDVYNFYDINGTTYFVGMDINQEYINLYSIGEDDVNIVAQVDHVGQNPFHGYVNTCLLENGSCIVTFRRDNVQNIYRVNIFTKEIQVIKKGSIEYIISVMYAIGNNVWATSTDCTSLIIYEDNHIEKKEFGGYGSIYKLDNNKYLYADQVNGIWHYFNESIYWEQYEYDQPKINGYIYRIDKIDSGYIVYSDISENNKKYFVRNICDENLNIIETTKIKQIVSFVKDFVVTADGKYIIMETYDNECKTALTVIGPDMTVEAAYCMPCNSNTINDIYREEGMSTTLLSSGKLLAIKGNGYFISDKSYGIEKHDDTVYIEKISATIDNDISINFYLNIPDNLVDNCDVLISGMKKEIGARDYQGYYKFSENVNAQDMGKQITIVVVDGYGNKIPIDNHNSVKEYFECSLRDYLNRIKNGSNELSELAKAIDNYGLYAEKYFNPSSAVDLPSIEKVDFSTYNVGMFESMSGGLEYLGSSLILNNQIVIRHYFKSRIDISAYVFKVNGNLVEPKFKDGLYYVDISGIIPSEYGKNYELSIARGNIVGKIEFSVFGYCGLIDNTNQELINLAYSLYWYNRSVENYLKSLNK